MSKQYTEFKFENLKGKILTKFEHYLGDLYFTDSKGAKYKMSHDSVCCESVWLEDVCGDLNDILDQELLLAECVTQNLSNKELNQCEIDNTDDCAQWTFYKLATLKNSVTLRWVGASNGYYSIDVDFECLTECSKRDQTDIIPPLSQTIPYHVLPMECSQKIIDYTFASNPKR